MFESASALTRLLDIFIILLPQT